MLRRSRVIWGLNCMNRIGKVFAEKKKIFISFITGGDPTLEMSKKLILAMDKAGAGLIEIGIPFSDPVAEGEVIQKANIRALASGTTTDKLFDMLREVRPQTEVPLVFLTYANPIYTYGCEKFFAQCAEIGIDGVIIPDTPFEEKGEFLPYSQKYKVALIPLIAPTSRERIKMIASQAEGFVYLVSSLGVTGMRSNITTDMKTIVEEVRKATSVPCAVGFGIATPDQAHEMAALSDGAIVGSAIEKIIEKYGEASVEPVCEYVKKMAEAVRQAV